MLATGFTQILLVVLCVCGNYHHDDNNTDHASSSSSSVDSVYIPFAHDKLCAFL